MPLYYYECECGRYMHITHSIKEDPEIKCSECGKTMGRKVSVPSISFKGSGFYSKDQGGGSSRG